MRPPVVIAVVCAAALATLLLRPRQEITAPAPLSPSPIPAAPVTPEQLAAEVEAIRGLRFKTPLKFVRVSEAELQEKARTAARVMVPSAEGALRVRTALALALIRPGQEFDVADCLAGSAMEVPAAHHDAAEATMWINEAFSPETRPDLTARLVFHLGRALLLQHPDIAPPLLLGNDDALLATLSVLHADAALTARRHAAQYAGRAAAGAEVPEASTYHASPPFLRAVLAFPAGAASVFHADLQKRMPDADDNQLLNRILASPPRSTAELLHPDSWPARPPPAVSVNRATFPPLSLLAENSLGEFGIRTLLKTQLTGTEADDAAAGLLSDRYFFFEGGGPGRDHLLWRTLWASDEDAGAFLRALAATHLGNAGVVSSESHFPNPNRFEAATPSLTLLAAIGDGPAVTLAVSPDSRMARRLLDSQ